MVTRRCTQFGIDASAYSPIDTAQLPAPDKKAEIYTADSAQSLRDTLKIHQQIADLEERVEKYEHGTIKLKGASKN